MLQLEACDLEWRPAGPGQVQQVQPKSQRMILDNIDNKY